LWNASYQGTSACNLPSSQLVTNTLTFPDSWPTSWRVSVPEWFTNTTESN